MTHSKNYNVERFIPHLEKMLNREILRPTASLDRQALARIADGIRSVCLVPVETVRLSDGVVGYRITVPDIVEYKNDRATQQARQRKVIELAQNRRDARRAKALFARLNIELPPEVAALAKANNKDQVVHINDVGDVIDVTEEESED